MTVSGPGCACDGVCASGRERHQILRALEAPDQLRVVSCLDTLVDVYGANRFFSTPENLLDCTRPDKPSFGEEHNGLATTSNAEKGEFASDTMHNNDRMN
ncbi:hypothetical protein J6590_014385 [Homalodisca vitripennis]|nr:hypothetical protein J6590_014385 [Homalodisca vitripennis]